MPSRSINTVLRNLTFDDLHDWAGETILNRGRNYVQRVEQLSRIADNTLAAWVTGSERYATSVRVGGEGDFEHFCTCPYDRGPCKHAVAVILAAPQRVKNNNAIPRLEEDDEAWQAWFGESEDDEGETAMAIASCLETVLAALP